MIKFGRREEEAVYQLARDLVGSCQDGGFRRSIILSNVRQRIFETSTKSLADYLKYIVAHPEEKDALISALTIHTTSWFREIKHYKEIVNRYSRDKNKDIKMLHVGCSTGQNSYSFALVFDFLRKNKVIKNWSIKAVDIDPVSIEFSKEGVYPEGELNKIPEEYKEELLIGSGPTEGYFTLSSKIKQGIKFEVCDVRELRDQSTLSRYSLIVCRNMLIYFDSKAVNRIVADYYDLLIDQGLLIIGHNEFFDSSDIPLKKIAAGMYKKDSALSKSARQRVQKQEKKRILVIDDSPVIVEVLSSIFQQQAIEFRSALSAADADSMLNQTNYNLITLDLGMTGKSGKDWLTGFRQRDQTTPVIVLSSTSRKFAHKILGTLEIGAQDYIDKADLSDSPKRVVDRVTAFFNRRTGQYRSSNFNKRPKKSEFIMIGASTGGTAALTKVLVNMPKSTPPVIVIQHISYPFALAFAQRLSEVSKLSLYEGSYPTKPKAGFLYMSTGDYHLVFDEQKMLAISTAPKVCNHRPSVEALFSSAASLIRGSNTSLVAAILTGMGRDGAASMKALNELGCYTLGQDAQSSTIYGMPKAAVELGAVDFVGNLDDIRKELLLISKS